MPDTFFRNEKDGNFHDIIQPNLYVRVFPDGDVLYSIRVGIENSKPPVYEHKKKCSGLPNPGLPDESEAVSPGHADMPPYHRQLWLDCKGPRVSLEGKEVLSLLKFQSSKFQNRKNLKHNVVCKSTYWLISGRIHSGKSVIHARIISI